MPFLTLRSRCPSLTPVWSLQSLELSGWSSHRGELLGFPLQSLVGGVGIVPSPTWCTIMATPVHPLLGLPIQFPLPGPSASAIWVVVPSATQSATCRDQLWQKGDDSERTWTSRTCLRFGVHPTKTRGCLFLHLRLAPHRWTVFVVWSKLSWRMKVSGP